MKKKKISKRTFLFVVIFYFNMFFFSLFTFHTSFLPKSSSLSEGNKLYNCGLIFFNWQLRHLNTFSCCTMTMMIKALFKKRKKTWKENLYKFFFLLIFVVKEFSFVILPKRHEKHLVVNLVGDFHLNPNTSIYLT